MSPATAQFISSDAETILGFFSLFGLSLYCHSLPLDSSLLCWDTQLVNITSVKAHSSHTRYKTII